MAMKKVRLLVRYGNYAGELAPPEAARSRGARFWLVAAFVCAIVLALLRLR